MPSKYQPASARKAHVVLGRLGTARERFDVKVRRDPDGCWRWLGSLNRCRAGYPQFWDGERLVKAHRWSFEQEHGSIPEGLTLDHLCGDTTCVNPNHLEPVSRRENALRATTSRRDG